MNNTGTTEILAGIDAAVEAGEMISLADALAEVEYAVRPVGIDGEMISIAPFASATIVENLSAALTVMTSHRVGFRRVATAGDPGRAYSWRQTDIAGWLVWTEAGVVRRFNRNGVEIAA